MGCFGPTMCHSLPLSGIVGNCARLLTRVGVRARSDGCAVYQRVGSPMRVDRVPRSPAMGLNTWNILEPLNQALPNRMCKYRCSFGNIVPLMAPLLDTVRSKDSPTSGSAAVNCFTLLAAGGNSVARGCAELKPRVAKQSDKVPLPRFWSS